MSLATPVTIQRGTILRHVNGEIHICIKPSDFNTTYITLKFLMPEDKNNALAHYYSMQLKNICMKLEPTEDSIAFLDVFNKLIMMQNIQAKYAALEYFQEEIEDYDNEHIPINAWECVGNFFSDEDIKKVFSDQVIQFKNTFVNHLRVLTTQMENEYIDARKEYIALHSRISIIALSTPLEVPAVAERES